VFWILCINAAFNGVPFWAKRSISNGLSACNENLFLDEINIVALFGLGMLTWIRVFISMK
jgi:hypothetical protein